MNKNKRAAVLIGPPGSGKTTVVQALTARNGMSVIETGSLLKSEIRRQTSLGLEIKPYTIAGNLVPTEWVVHVISAELKKARERIVLFDGFPRNAGQLEAFFQLLKEHRMKLGAVFVLTLDLKTAMERLGGRRICPGCGAVFNVHTNPPGKDGSCDRCGGQLIKREDDREEVIRRRFVNFEQETFPVIEFFVREHTPMTWQASLNSTLDENVTQIRQRLDEAVARPVGRGKDPFQADETTRSLPSSRSERLPEES